MVRRCKSFTTNPYDGHTLAAQMKQVKSMIGERVGEVHVDMGYRGHDYTGQATVHVDKRSRGRTPRTLWRWMKRRAAVEPSIGHLKTEHRLERNRLKGVAGDALNAILAAAAMNFQKLLRAFWLCFLRALLEKRMERASDAFVCVRYRMRPARACTGSFERRLRREARSGQTDGKPIWDCKDTFMTARYRAIKKRESICFRESIA
jgi:hypothetical protein